MLDMSKMFYYSYYKDFVKIGTAVKQVVEESDVSLGLLQPYIEMLIKVIDEIEAENGKRRAN